MLNALYSSDERWQDSPNLAAMVPIPQESMAWFDQETFDLNFHVCRIRTKTIFGEREIIGLLIPSSCDLSARRTLSIVFAMVILSTATRKSSPDDFPKHSLGFLNRDLRRLPDPCLPLIFPSMIRRKNSYRSGCPIMCPKYSSFRISTVSLTS